MDDHASLNNLQPLHFTKKISVTKGRIQRILLWIEDYFEKQNFSKIRVRPFVRNG